jgi:hypothetical protein
VQDEGTIGVEAMQAFRTWVCVYFDADMDLADNVTVVTRKPRVLHWCSRCAKTLFYFGMGRWICVDTIPEMYGARHNYGSVLVTYLGLPEKHSKQR